jgi:hypothetical protein
VRGAVKGSSTAADGIAPSCGAIGALFYVLRAVNAAGESASSNLAYTYAR